MVDTLISLKKLIEFIIDSRRSKRGKERGEIDYYRSVIENESSLGTSK